MLPHSKVGTEVKWSGNHTEVIVFAEDVNAYLHRVSKDKWGKSKKSRLYILKDCQSNHSRLIIHEDKILCNFLIQPSSGSNIKQLDRSTATMVWIPDTRYETNEESLTTKGQFITIDFNEPSLSKELNDVFKAAVTQMKVNAAPSSASGNNNTTTKSRSGESKRETKNMASTWSKPSNNNNNNTIDTGENKDNGETFDEGPVSFDAPSTYTPSKSGTPSFGAPLNAPATNERRKVNTARKSKQSLKQSSAPVVASTFGTAFNANNLAGGKVGGSKSTFSFGGETTDSNANKTQQPTFGFGGDQTGGDTSTAATSFGDSSSSISFGGDGENKQTDDFANPSTSNAFETPTTTAATKSNVNALPNAPMFGTPSASTPEIINDENNIDGIPSSSSTMLSASEATGGLLTDANPGEDPLGFDVMKRRLTKLYEIVNPAKVPDAGKNVDKYKSKGQPGLCLMSAKLEKKYPEHWKHNNPNNVGAHKSPSKKSTQGLKTQSTPVPAAVSFGGNTSAAVAPVNFGFGGGDTKPAFGSSGGGDTTFGGGFGQAAANGNVSFSAGAATTDSTSTSAFGGGFGGGDTAPSFGGASFDVNNFSGGGGDNKTAGTGTSAFGGGSGTSAFGGGAATTWGSSDTPSFGSTAPITNGGNNTQQQPMSNAFAAMGNNSVSFGSPSTR